MNTRTITIIVLLAIAGGATFFLPELLSKTGDQWFSSRGEWTAVRLPNGGKLSMRATKSLDRGSELKGENITANATRLSCTEHTNGKYVEVLIDVRNDGTVTATLKDQSFRIIARDTKGRIYEEGDPYPLYDFSNCGVEFQTGGRWNRRQLGGWGEWLWDLKPGFDYSEATMIEVAADSVIDTYGIRFFTPTPSPRY